MSTKETSQPGNAKKANSSSFIISISLFAIITAVILFKDEEKKKRLIELITNKMFVSTTIGIIIFSTYMLSLPVEDNDENQKLHNATKQGLLGFIIAILAYLDLKAAPFFIIWVVSYYLDV